MLKWIGKHLQGGSAAYGDLKVDCRMLHWFFMLRAREFADSNGIDQVRGMDVALTTKGGRTR